MSGQFNRATGLVSCVVAKVVEINFDYVGGGLRPRLRSTLGAPAKLDTDKFGNYVETKPAGFIGIVIFD